MMKKRTVAAALAAALALALLCSGCAPTQEQVIKRMQKAVDQTPCRQLSSYIDMQLTLAAVGLEMDLAAEAGADTQISYDPTVIHQTTETAFKLGGVRIPFTSETYTVTEDGRTVTYLGTGGTWECTEGTDPQSAAGTVDYSTYPLIMDEETSMLGDREVYVLRGTMSGDVLRDRMGGMLDDIGNSIGDAVPGIGGLESGASAEEPDWDAITVEITLYVNSKTWLPAREELKVSGMEVTLGALFGQTLTLRANSCTAVTDYISYDASDAPVTVPQEVRDSAGAPGQPQHGEAASAA